MRITLPLPTALNRTYKSGQGHWYKSQESRNWEAEATYALIKSGYRQKHRMIEEDVHLDIVFYLKRDRDIDSGLKILLDFMQDKIYRNDRQVKELHVIKVQSKEPRVDINL